MNHVRIAILIIYNSLLILSCSTYARHPVGWVENSRIFNNTHIGAILVQDKLPFKIISASVTDAAYIDAVGVNSRIVTISPEGCPLLLPDKYPGIQMAMASLSHSELACAMIDKILIMSSNGTRNAMIDLQPWFDKRFISEKVISILKETPMQLVSLSDGNWLAYDPYFGVLAFGNGGEVLYRINYSDMDRVPSLPPFKAQIIGENKDQALICACYFGFTTTARIEVIRISSKGIIGHLSVGESGYMPHCTRANDQMICIGIEKQVLLIDYSPKIIAKYMIRSPIVFNSGTDYGQCILVCEDGAVYGAIQSKIILIGTIGKLQSPWAAHYLVSNGYLVVTEKSNVQVINLKDWNIHHISIPAVCNSVEPLMINSKSDLIFNIDGSLEKLGIQ